MANRIVSGLIIGVVVIIGFFITYKFTIVPIKERQQRIQKGIEFSYKEEEKIRLKAYPNIIGVVKYYNPMTEVYTVAFVDNNNHYYEESFHPRHLIKYDNANH